MFHTVPHFYFTSDIYYYMITLITDMAIYLKKFENHTQYDNYINGSGAILPNVSICTTEGDVHYNPYVEPETRVVAKFNVTDTSSPTPIGYNQYTSGFSEIEIDGVETAVTSAYTFTTTGEHTVKYTLTDPTSIGNYAFRSCSSLISIDIPDGVTSIGNSAFENCSGMTTCTIGDGVTSIGSQAFYNCRSLTSIVIPNSVTSIGGSAFQYCYSLTNVTIPDSVTSIGNYAFEYCSSLTSCTIGSGVTSIGERAFASCTGLTSVNIPSGVTSIGQGAFYDCRRLTSIAIPDSATRIDNEAFATCSSLTSVTIGTGVTTIGNYTFYQCSGLTSIVSNATTAPTIANSTFIGVKIGGTLYVPQGSTGYDVWMGTGNYYLGKYDWSKVEQ